MWKSPCLTSRRWYWLKNMSKGPNILPKTATCSLPKRFLGFYNMVNFLIKEFWKTLLPTFLGNDSDLSFEIDLLKVEIFMCWVCTSNLLLHLFFHKCKYWVLFPVATGHWYITRVVFFPHLRTFFIHYFWREKNIDVREKDPIHAWSGDQTHNLGMCPGKE